MEQQGEAPYLSVVVPAHNEAARLGATLQAMHKYLQDQGYRYEIVVVDDVSRDATGEVARSFQAAAPILRVLRRDANPGKGAAVQAGMLAARGRYVLFSDADNSTPIDQTAKLLAALEAGHDIAIGSRALPDSNLVVRQPWYREGMGRIFNLLVRLVALRQFVDTQCGFKCFRQEVSRELFSHQTVPGWAFDVEVLFMALRRGYRVAEIPVTWINSRESRVSPVRSSLQMLRDLLGLRWKQLCGRYRWTQRKQA